jgi:hypothetical protein
VSRATADPLAHAPRLQLAKSVSNHSSTHVWSAPRREAIVRVCKGIILCHWRLWLNI